MKLILKTSYSTGYGQSGDLWSASDHTSCSLLFYAIRAKLLIAYVPVPVGFPGPMVDSFPRKIRIDYSSARAGHHDNNIIICEWCHAVRMLGIKFRIGCYVFEAQAGLLTGCVSAIGKPRPCYDESKRLLKV
jgi:hypothetical protein